MCLHHLFIGKRVPSPDDPEKMQRMMDFTNSLISERKFVKENIVKVPAKISLHADQPYHRYNDMIDGEFFINRRDLDAAGEKYLVVTRGKNRSGVHSSLTFRCRLISGYGNASLDQAIFFLSLLHLQDSYAMLFDRARTQLLTYTPSQDC